MSTRVVRSRAEFLVARADLGRQLVPARDGGATDPRPTSSEVGAVLTMGALHAGHEALLDAARAANAAVVATIFVNPTQFAPGEDLNRYPRPRDADLATMRRHQIDVVWTPDIADVYPSAAGRSQNAIAPSHDATIGLDPGPLGRELEGAARPGHFAGMLLVVAKFLQLIRPDSAYFGEKDYQQLTLIRAMVRDLELPVNIVAVPTVREDDGLARSSRNVFLDAEQRAEAAVLSRALFAGRSAGADGPRAVLAAARAELARCPDVEVDYLELRDDALGPAPERGSARLLVAARVGPTRLIDNVGVELSA